MTSTPSKLLFVHGSADLYGSDVTLLQLISGLDRNRFYPIVIVPYAGPLVSYLRTTGAEVIIRPDLPVLRRQNMNARGLIRVAVSSFQSIPWLITLMRRRRIVLVHSNTLAVLVAGLAASFAGYPQVWHLHEIVTQPRVAASLLATLSSALSTVVVANSQATADHHRRMRLVASAPVRVIVNGAYTPQLHKYSGSSLRHLVGAGPSDTVFTLIGRVNRLKGHSVFINAAEKLAAEFEDVRFLVVGDSFYGQEWLSEAVDYRIESSDTLRNRMIRIPHIAEVDRVYAASNVIVVPSIQPESFGLVAVEAMAAALPVVASRIGALPEVIEDRHTGLLVESNDASSLLTAMKQLKASPSQRAVMGHKGRERYEEYFRVERYVNEFSKLYDDILESSWKRELAY